MTTSVGRTLADCPDDPRHGSVRGYWIGCRCDRCRAAKRAHNTAKRRAAGVQPKKLADAEIKQRAIATAVEHGLDKAAEETGWGRSTIAAWCRAAGRTPLRRPPLGCGTVASYTRGCRCDECRAANYKRAKAYRSQPMPESVQHGTPSAYGNWKCRCDACKAAGSAVNAATLRFREDRIAMGLARIPHGTHSGFSTWHCRCEECTAAGPYQKRRRR